MPASILKKRKVDDEVPTKRPKKFRKQKHYTSSSSGSASEDEDDEFPAIDLAASDSETDVTSPKADQSSASSDPDSDNESSTSHTLSNTTSTTSNPKSKRNDPNAFATSISAILNSKLSTAKRPDPVLSRSATAQEASTSVSNDRLEARAKRKLHAEKRKAMDQGRIRDVLLGVTVDGKTGIGGGTAESVKEEERKLKKTAQRGVVKLFNAVRAAQVKAEEARGLGGTRDRKEERVGEMSKKGFLDMVASGGKGKTIEEA